MKRTQVAPTAFGISLLVGAISIGVCVANYRSIINLVQIPYLTEKLAQDTWLIYDGFEACTNGDEIVKLHVLNASGALGIVVNDQEIVVDENFEVSLRSAGMQGSSGQSDGRMYYSDEASCVRAGFVMGKFDYLLIERGCFVFHPGDKSRVRVKVPGESQKFVEVFGSPKYTKQVSRPGI